MAHGKSTVVKAISGVHTVRFKNELERNITIKLGYANAKIYKAKDPRVPRPACYKAFGSAKEDNPACEVAGMHALSRDVWYMVCACLLGSMQNFNSAYSDRAKAAYLQALQVIEQWHHCRSTVAIACAWGQALL